MSEVLHTVGNVRLVQDDEPGDFPDWGDGGFQLFTFGHAKWWVSEWSAERVESSGLPDRQQLQNAVENWAWEWGSMERWLRAYYNPKATVREYTGYSQGDYWSVISMEGDTTTSDQIAAWAMGDVWRLALEYKVTYEYAEQYYGATYRDSLPVEVDPTIEVWVRDPDSGATAHGDDDREAIIEQFKAEMGVLDVQPTA